MKLLKMVLLIIAALLIFGCSPKDKYSLDQFNQIRPGMSYSQCVSILKAEGKLTSENYMPGVPGVMAPITTKGYTWKNENGSNMFFIFQNDKLVNKAQAGLK